MGYKVTYKPFGEHALLIEWPAQMDEAILLEMLALDEALQQKDFILETIQSVNSITVMYRPTSSYKEVKSRVTEAYKNLSAIGRTSTLWKLPVCYDGVFGLDLPEVSASSGLSTSQIIQLHSGTQYTVYSIGFLPGFLYLGGLDEQLHMERKAQPRMQIPKGAVGIGGQQTGIYPSASPGGWQIIGNCPVTLFDPGKGKPCFTKPGDCIEFAPVSIEEHEGITALVEAGIYQIEKEVLDD